MANFATEPALSNKSLLVSLVLGCIALQGCVDTLIGAYPVPLPLYVPSKYCCSHEGFELLLHISINTTPTLLAATQAFSKVSACKSSTYSRILGFSPATNLSNYFIISDTHYMRCSMIECCYIAANVMHTILCAFVQVIPSPPVPILRPKIVLYQLFQVFPRL